MTPQERQLVDDLFERLSKLEGAPRDADAARAIAEGLRRAPNAIYPLVQTVLVQDEALKRADAQIRELNGEQPAQGGFLDSMRNMFAPNRASVPSVRPADDRWGTQQQQSPFGGSGGSSFLGTAAATAAGVIGGALLMNSFRSMFGGGGNAHTAYDSPSPWSGGDGGQQGPFDDSNTDYGNADSGGSYDTADSGDIGGDFGGDGGGDA